VLAKSCSYSLIPALENKIIKDPIAKAVNREYEIENNKSRLGTQIEFHKKSANTKYSGNTTIEQNMGSEAAIAIRVHVNAEIFVSSSHLFFLIVLNLQANEAKLNTEIRGVINGKANIKRI